MAVKGGKSGTLGLTSKTSIDRDEICLYSVIRRESKKGRQRDTLKNIQDKSKWNFKNMF